MVFSKGGVVSVAFVMLLVGCPEPAPTVIDLEAIEVTPDPATVQDGDSLQMTAIGSYSDGSTLDITGDVDWALTSYEFGTISEDGLFVAVEPGAVSIVASIEDLSDQAAAQITDADLVSLTIETPATTAIADGLMRQYTARGLFSDGESLDMTTLVVWTSANPSIATISNADGSRGLLTAQGPGSSSITATSGTVSDDLAIEVSAATIVSLVVTPDAPTVPDGLTQQFECMGTFTDGTQQSCTAAATWASGNQSIASIVTGGLATMESPGSTTISATFGSATDSTPLEVDAAVLTGIAIDPASVTFADGLTQQFTCTATYSAGPTQDCTNIATWSSSNPDIATIGSTGLATTVGNTAVGGFTVTGAFGGFTDTSAVTVTTAAVSSIEVTPADGWSIPIGTTLPFGVIVTFSDLSTCTIGATCDVGLTATWSASPSPGISVDAAGIATASPTTTTGAAAVTAQVGGFSDSSVGAISSAILVTVTVDPPSFDDCGDPWEDELPIGGFTTDFYATGLYSDGAIVDLTDLVTWTTNAGTVATVSVDGTVTTGTAPGTAIITATYGPVIGNLSFDAVDASLTSIDVTPGAPTVLAGGTQQFEAQGTFDNGLSYCVMADSTWSTTNSNCFDIGATTGLGTAGSQTCSSQITASIGAIDDVVTVNVAGPDPALVVRHPEGVLPAGTAFTYGPVISGTTELTSVTIENPGGSGLMISGAGFVDPENSSCVIVTFPASTVAPGGSTTMSFSYGPVINGTSECALEIESNDPNNSLYRIQIVGKGTSPLGNFDDADGQYVGTGGCGINTATLRTDEVISFHYGPSFQTMTLGGSPQVASGTGMTIFGIGFHTCTLTLAGIGFTALCTSSGGGTCSESFTRTVAPELFAQEISNAFAPRELHSGDRLYADGPFDFRPTTGDFFLVNRGPPGSVLDLSSLSLQGGGTNCAGVTATILKDGQSTALPVTLTSSGVADFSVLIQTQAPGYYDCSVAIGNNDSDENPFVLNIRGW